MSEDLLISTNKRTSGIKKIFDLTLRQRICETLDLWINRNLQINRTLIDSEDYYLDSETSATAILTNGPPTRKSPSQLSRNRCLSQKLALSPLPPLIKRELEIKDQEHHTTRPRNSTRSIQETPIKSTFLVYPTSDTIENIRPQRT